MDRYVFLKSRWWKEPALFPCASTRGGAAVINHGSRQSQSPPRHRELMKLCHRPLRTKWNFNNIAEGVMLEIQSLVPILTLLGNCPDCDCCSAVTFSGK
ncbi:hypothetical protein SKAU_G00349500 [Synaphobranchus kaupii]|uniref:Uncharacterized protein n=1 Tax=Synaphobranchus kaupii TaxID=118154 RepID=A0A9Q1EK73_SYNKA|nr:hypothetical protein SKAU_G00349500 [Synaphobranchus kaupii]